MAKSNEAPELSIKLQTVDLVSVLARVNAIVEKRNTIPILSFAKVEAINGRVLFTASDLDIEITDSIEAGEIDMAGVITVPAGTLYDIARKLPKGADISLVARDRRVEIDSGRSSFNIPILPPGDFPIMSNSSFDSEFTMSCDALRELIDKTKFAMSTEETRYYLNGIFLTSHGLGGENVKLRTVATDGHRLALSEIKAPDGGDAIHDTIIPKKTILQIRRIMDGYPKDESITVRINEGKIQFSIGDLTMTSKVIDGTFPDYERVIPRNNEKQMTVDVQIFAKAVDRVATISENKSRSIALEISSDVLNLKSESAGSGGSAEEELNVSYSADDIRIGFNAKYLADTFSQIESAEAIFYLDGPASPVLVKDPKNEGSLFVLMPLRV